MRGEGGNIVWWGGGAGPGVAQRNKVGVFTIIELTILDNFQLEHA
jgi:hypothetical protein